MTPASQNLQQEIARLSEENRQLKERLQGQSQALVEAEKFALAGQMSGTVAHQLRNPLSVISASAQLLMQEQEEGGESRRMMEMVCQKVSEMDAIIGVLQELGKPMEVKLRQGSVAASLRAIHSFIAPRCASQGVALSLELAEGLPEVWLDEERFQRSLLDLCVNSLQAMPRGGKLALSARPAGGGVEVRVEDDGPGFPAEALSRLFEPFASTKARGSGLGLYNVRRVADAMGAGLKACGLKPHGAGFLFSFSAGAEKPKPISRLAWGQAHPGTPT
jgi:two-component system sensor histidine kinase HydH